MAALLNLHVLLAEDDENDVILIRHAFKHLDCLGRLMVVPDGEHVLAYLQGDPPYGNRAVWPLPGVLVLDQTMPKVSGIDVLCWIRTEPRFCKLPVVLWSGVLRPSEQSMLTGLQASLCIKSVDLKESARLIEEAIVDAVALARGGWFRDAGRETFMPALGHAPYFGEGAEPAVPQVA